MQITDNYLPERNRNTYVIELDKPVLPKGLFNFFALATDARKVARCSLLQDLLKKTPVQYDQPHAIYSFQIENTEKGGTRLVMKSRPYAFIQPQVDAMLDAVWQRVKSPMALAANPLIDGAGVLEDIKNSRRDDEFKPNESYRAGKPKLYYAQTALYAALTTATEKRSSVLNKIRSDGGDVHYLNIGADQETGEISFDLIATGSCTGCNSSLYTMLELYTHLVGNIAALAQQGSLKGHKMGRINVHQESDMSLAYSVSEYGIHDARDVLTQRFPKQIVQPA